ncbi:MAG: AhpC/TSA family protein [Bacteroidia bacterium]|nr:AhpC/TSA family protein [Bacteroidia bacterium]
MLKSLFFILFAASVGSASAHGFIFHAKITGFPDGTKFYLYDLDFQKLIDSALIKKNQFRMKGTVGDIPQFIRLYTTVENESYYFNIFMGNESVNVTGDKKDFPFYLSVTGSPSQGLYKVLNKQTNKLYERREKLMKKVITLMHDTTKEGKAEQTALLKIIKPIDSTVEAIRIAFLRSHLNSYVGLKELNFLKSRFGKAELQKMYATLEDSYKESLYGKQLLTYIEVGDPVKKGDIAFDFEAIDTSGKKYTLSGFKGKYVLLDFGYASCGACFLSLPELKKMDSLYKDKLAIISFSTDLAKEVWYKGIIRDQPSWLSLWDGEGTFAKPVLKYNVTGYPTFVLIDPDGKIAWMNSGYGDNMFTELLPKYIK